MTFLSTNSWVNLASGSNPFVDEWNEHKEEWAEQDAQTWEYIYRRLWNIPRHDPRLEKMTPEEFEYEVLLHEKYQQILKRGPIDPELQKRIEEWAKGEDDALPIPQAQEDYWEDVEPSEVFNDAGRNQGTGRER